MAIKFKSDFDTSQNTDNSGASNNGPLLDNGSKKKFSPVSIFVVFSIIATLVMVVHAIAPIALIFIWLCMLMVVFIVVFAPTIFTLGLIWTSDGFKSFAGSVYGTFLFLGQDGVQQDALIILSKSFWYVLYIGGALILIGLVWSILEFNNQSNNNRIKKRRMIKIIVCAVIFAIASIFAGFLLANGQS